MEAKQTAQLVAQVGWRKGKLEKLKKIKGEEIRRRDTYSHTSRIHQILFGGLIKGMYSVTF